MSASRVLLPLCAAVCLLAAGSASAAPVPYQRGVTVGEWGPTAYEPVATKASFKRLRKLHVDTVTLFAVYMQAGERSNSVRPGSETVVTRRLVKAIRSARSAGLRVILRPYIDRDDGGWRGAINPQSVDAWFSSYARFVRTYARLAQKEKVVGFVVGSELTTVSGEADRWRALVRSVRDRFKGFVTYQANWDEAERVAWWDALDTISISAYYPLSTAPDPTTAELVAGWTTYVGPFASGGANWFARIDALRQRFGKSVFFGEIGYRPRTFTSNRPWDTGSFGTPSSSAQTRGYEAALRVWSSVSWFRGFEWWLVAPNAKLAPASNGGHEPTGPALKVLKRFYGERR